MDTSNHFTRYEMNREVLKILEEYKHIPSVLILNKVRFKILNLKALSKIEADNILFFFFNIF